MTTVNPAGHPAHRAGNDSTAHAVRRLSAETKPALKATGFFICLASVVAVLIASIVVGDDDGHADYFRADKAWPYLVVLTVGHMISRGLARPGSRDSYDDNR
ncbi:hypothetical protein [Streptomyces sp. NPDC058291]|jgi:hypothetical protein|uniref:hypothetical protein n=1 Tax=Streptomyces sp. NPDC058291 TaxID=3346427 RepID=UPI0036E87FB7